MSRRTIPRKHTIRWLTTALLVSASCCLLVFVTAEDEAALIQSRESTTLTKTTPTQDVKPGRQEVQEEAQRMYELGLAHFNGTTKTERDLTKALQFFNRSSQLGHPGAQFMVALFHTNGLVVPRNEGMAVLHLTFAALSGDVDAQLSLANRHFHGYSVSKSCSDAARYYRLVAEKVAKSHKDSGVIAHIEKIRLSDEGALQRRQTEEDMMQYYQYSADKGNTQSMMVLGRAYMFGARGLNQDAAQAEAYFQRAIDAKDPAAYGAMGTLHAQGVEGGPKPLPRNYTKALQYFRTGAALGHPVSLNGLGFLHMGGHGVEANYTEAARFFRIAADQANPEAQYNIGVLYLNGEGTLRDPEKAMKYLQLAAQQGQVLAHYQLGNIYSDGLGNQQPNCHMAVKFYKAVSDKGAWNHRLEEAHKAYLDGETTTALLQYLIVAEQGYEIGEDNVAWMFDQRYGIDEIPFDLIHPIHPENWNKNSNNKWSLSEACKERALFWYTRAAGQGNVDAMIKVGDYHYYGWGTPVDLAESVDKYRQAADRMHPQAMFNLGYMHEHGRGIPKDFHLAKRFYDQASSTSEKAWTPVQMALIKLHVHRWLHRMVSAQTGNAPPMRIYGIRLEDLILAFLVVILILLLLLRQSAQAPHAHRD